MLKTYISLIANVGATQIHNKDDSFVIEGVPITVDNAVMNGIRYPAEENEAGMKSLENKVVTLSHPQDEQGNRMDAYEGVALQKHYSGGHVTNTYRKDGVWYADININKKRLAAAEDGQEFIERLENKQPIGVSTGLYTLVDDQEGEEGGIKYRGNATMQDYNHLAMLRSSERPAGGDATVMRFNGEDIEHEVVMLSNMLTMHNSEGLDFTGGHRAKMRQFEQQIKEALMQRLDEDEVYVDDWNDDTIIFYYDGDTYAIGYQAGDGIELNGDPQKVTMAATYQPVEVPKQETQEQGDGGLKEMFKAIASKLGFASAENMVDNNNCKQNFTTNEGMSMSHYGIIATKLNLNEEEVKALSDEALAEKLDALGGGEPQEQVSNAAVDALVEEVKSLKEQLANQANASKAKLVTELAANEAVGLSEAMLNKLDEAELQELADKHSQVAGINPQFNSASAPTFDELPD